MSTPSFAPAPVMASPSPRAKAARLRRQIAALSLTVLVCMAAPAQCQDGSEWDRARAQLLSTAPGSIGPAISRWRQLVGTDSAGFDAYASFLLAWPGLPDETRMRMNAEKSLALYPVDAGRLVAFFDRFPPLTNPARAQYALALAQVGRPEAAQVARAAWRGGTMADTAESAIQQRWGSSFTQDDQNARLDAVLWDGNRSQAQRVLPYASAALQSVAQARLAIQSANGGSDAPNGSVQPSDDAAAMEAATRAANPGLFTTPVPTSSYAPPPPPPAPVVPPPSAEMLSDPGYLVDRARMLFRQSRSYEAASMYAQRPTPIRPALDARRWVQSNLMAARAADPRTAINVALNAQNGFAPGTDISRQAFGVRDDYTSLMWLGASQAMWTQNDYMSASTLFARYAGAARTPQTRAKGYYWAGRALEKAGQSAQARNYFQSASAFADEYHGMLSLERLGLPLPPLSDPRHPTPDARARAAFAARPIAQAARELARDTDWTTAIKFFRELADQARTEQDFVLLEDFAHSIGRRDLGVIGGQAAENLDIPGFRAMAFPLMPVPAGANWTIDHAITRQESQFSQYAISRTGARGLMQLMPATAADQARKLGIAYSPSTLSSDPQANLQLGDAYFARVLAGFNGSYPLAIAAYNAGGGNVRKWIAARGDPRGGSTDNWVDWIEKIPFSETRGYVQHVLENAVVYEAMNPSRAKISRGSTPLSHFIKVPAPMPVTALPPAPVDSAPADGFVSQPVVQQIPPGAN
ncbi:lytic transglycosylase domain-containing protein [Novosphingobium terrae]|uniref:lytic transglycosylase domain-containing protein n=1 Tax=Novosphingobium terrae TaxID=2726189 RepID=UPI00197E66E4|nr:lytic transglycosylase domain-containing protein [Novosphingobium terrae]